ncbi:MAG: PIN domain nuclease [Deferribacteres bacterium]|nr:PIN domain nuclease [Deferribacteres bacterium]
MINKIIQIAIVISGIIFGALLGKVYGSYEGLILGGFIGLIGSVFILYLIKKIIEFKLKGLLGTALGVSSGILLSWLTSSMIPVSFPRVELEFMFRLFLALTFGYLGGLVGAKIAESFEMPRMSRSQLKVISRGSSPKILDTSAIIDGRIADVCDTGFFEYTLIVPNFVLKELQHIADSTDPIVRNKGRRGFEILQRLKENPYIKVKLVNTDFPEIKEVDEKLIALAKKMKTKIITTDYNLNQLAKLQGIEVLNINDLAKALRPVVLPGEELEIFIIKQGKDPRQGVGYLEDGTMVVVEEGKNYIGKKIKIVVTSLLQTSTGRIIFGKPKDAAKEIHSSSHHHKEERKR